MEVLRKGYRLPFLRPPLSAEPIPMPSYFPTFIKGAALEEVTLGVDCQGCCGACSSSLSRLLQPPVCGLEGLGVVATGHQPVPPRLLRGRFALPHGDHPVCSSVCPAGGLDGLHQSWEAYLQVPVHPESRRFLCFVAHGRTYQFKALCFGLSTAPQVFTRVMAPVSAILHSLGICMRRYLDDWLVQASSREALLRDLGIVLSLCCELGIVINPEKSNFSPSRVVQYLGVVIDARTFMASPSPDRVSRLRSTSGEFLCSAAPPASLWQSLLGMLSSLSHLVLGGRLRMRSLQICLHRSWDRLDPSALVLWSLDCLRDLRWWLRGDRLSRGMSLHQVSPDLDFWSDSSDVGWGAHLGDKVVSSLWD